MIYLITGKRFFSNFSLLRFAEVRPMEEKGRIPPVWAAQKALAPARRAR